MPPLIAVGPVYAKLLPVIVNVPLPVFVTDPESASDFARKPRARMVSSNVTLATPATAILVEAEATTR